jgi:hypothetical protein
LKNIFLLGYLNELLLASDDYLPDTLGKVDPLKEAELKGFSLLKPKVIVLINWIYINNELTHHEIIIKE